MEKKLYESPEFEFISFEAKERLAAELPPLEGEDNVVSGGFPNEWV